MTGRNSLHYCYDVSYQCWFASEEAKIYCNNFNSSNAVVCSHLILAYTVRLALINAAELERNSCFSLLLLRNVVLWLKRTSMKSLQIELVAKYDTNDAKKEVFVGGSNLRRGVHIRWRIWTGGVEIRCDTGTTSTFPHDFNFLRRLSFSGTTLIFQLYFFMARPLTFSTGRLNTRIKAAGHRRSIAM